MSSKKFLETVLVMLLLMGGMTLTIYMIISYSLLEWSPRNWHWALRLTMLVGGNGIGLILSILFLNRK